jgi:hypothetical protein
MMRGVPAAFVLVPFKERKIRNPEETEVALAEAAVTIGEFIGDGEAELPGGAVDGIGLLPCL